VELRIQGLSKSYGSRVALRDVTIEITPGKVALLGPNGSGKTTLLRCLATLLQPDNGGLWFDGLPYAQNSPWFRSQIGYLPQELHFPHNLTPRQLLEYLGTLKNISESGQVDYLLSALGLKSVADRPFGRLSGGQIRLTGIAQAFLGKPSLLLLDELTRGLDVEERERVFALARKSSSGRLIVFSTHDPPDVERFTEQAIVLQQGRVIFSGKTEDLHHHIPGYHF
jgi:ABC-type multidrug transport system ATPase subunit